MKNWSIKNLDHTNMETEQDTNNSSRMLIKKY